MESPFPEHPASWHYLCRRSELRAGPRTFPVGGRTMVAFLANGKDAVAMDSRCSHFGADLGRGCVVGDRLRCPFHAWEYGPDGACRHIPAAADIPAFARQATFPVVDRAGHLFVFNRPEAFFPMPFFEGTEPADLLPARPFELVADIPWYLVGSNGFDLQHFRVAHDRTLVGGHCVDSPSPFARRIVATYAVTGPSIRDRLTRQFSGPQVTMSVTDWCGNLILVTARFRRTTSYGMVCTRPLGPAQTLLRVIVWVPRSAGAIGRMLVDPLDAWIRRGFIRAFVRSDIDRTAGARYNPGTLIEADRELADYFDWLKLASRGVVHSARSDPRGSLQREIS